MAHPVAQCEDAPESVEHFRDLWHHLADPRDPPREKLASVLARECEAFDMSVAYLSHIDRAEDRQTFDVVEPADFPLSAGDSIPLSSSYCRKTIEAPEGTLAISDATAEGWDEDPAYDQFGVDTYLGTTVEVEEELYGTLCFARPEARADSLTDSEVALADMLAEWTGYELAVRQRELQAERATVEDEEDAGGTMTDTPTTATLWPEEVDRLMDALCKRPRRVVLAGLRDGSVGTEADLVGLDRGPDLDVVSLEHNHLPRLADAGLIEWDRDTGAIERGPEFDAVEPVLACLLDAVEEVDAGP